MPDELPAYLAPLRDGLIAARRARARIPVDGLPAPRTDADAYAVQRAVADEFGWFAARPTAWKVGAASRTAIPGAAPLPSGVVHASPATFQRGTFNRILIEGEIAFRLRAPLGGDAATRDEAAVSAAIGELVVTIEIVDPRYDNLEAASPALRLADQSLHGALVVGSSVPWRGRFDWVSQIAVVRSNGTNVRETRGGHPLGDLLFLPQWLARHAAQRGTTLAAGDLVTAGTWTGVFEAGPGQTIDVEFPGVGQASARFE